MKVKTNVQMPAEICECAHRSGRGHTAASVWEDLQMRTFLCKCLPSVPHQVCVRLPISVRIHRRLPAFAHLFSLQIWMQTNTYEIAPVINFSCSNTWTGEFHWFRLRKFSRGLLLKWCHFFWDNKDCSLKRAFWGYCSFQSPTVAAKAPPTHWRILRILQK